VIGIIGSADTDFSDRWSVIGTKNLIGASLAIIKQTLPLSTVSNANWWHGSSASFNYSPLSLARLAISFSLSLPPKTAEKLLGTKWHSRREICVCVNSQTVGRTVTPGERPSSVARWSDSGDRVDARLNAFCSSGGGTERNVSESRRVEGGLVPLPPPGDGKRIQFLPRQNFWDLSGMSSSGCLDTLQKVGVTQTIWCFPWEITLLFIK